MPSSTSSLVKPSESNESSEPWLRSFARPGPTSGCCGETCPCHQRISRLESELTGLHIEIGKNVVIQMTAQRAGRIAMQAIFDDVEHLTTRVSARERSLEQTLAELRAEIRSAASRTACAPAPAAEAIPSDDALAAGRTETTVGRGSPSDHVEAESDDAPPRRLRFDPRSSADRAFPPLRPDLEEDETLHTPSGASNRYSTRAVPISALRSKAELTYDPRNDPSEEARLRPGLFEDREDTSDERLKKLKLPDAKDFPVFEGKAKHPSTVAARLRTWIDSVNLYVAARDVPLAVVRSYLPVMLKNDALDMLKGMARERPGGLTAFSFNEIIQRLLNRYVTVSQMIQQDKALSAWRFPDPAYKDPGVWAAAFLDACRQVDAEKLDVEKFISRLTVCLSTAITRDLRQLSQDEQWTDVGQVVLGFDKMITEVQEKAALFHELNPRGSGGSAVQSRPPLASGRENRDGQRPRRDRYAPRSGPAVIDQDSTAAKVRTYAAEVRKLEEMRACYGCGRVGHIRRHCPEPETENRHGRPVAIVLACAALGIEPGNESEGEGREADSPPSEEPLEERELEDTRDLNIGAISAPWGPDAEDGSGTEDAGLAAGGLRVGVITVPNEDESLTIANAELRVLAPNGPYSFEDSKAYAQSLLRGKGEGRKAVLPIPPQFVERCIRESKQMEARVFLDTEPGKMHQEGQAWKLPFVIMNFERSPLVGLIDSGAQPTLCKAAALSRVDPDFRRKLVPFAKTLQGLAGSAPVILGLYSTTIVLPHWDQPLFLPRVEFIVSEYDLAYDFILGQDLSAVYGFNLMRPARLPPYLKVGEHSQLFHLGQAAAPPLSQRLDQIRVVEKKTKKSNRILPAGATAFDHQNEGTLYPSGRKDVLFDDFLDIFTRPRAGSAEFHSALEKANISPSLSTKQRDQLLLVLCAAEGAFALEGQVYDRPRLGVPLSLDIKMPDPAPRNLKRGYYPCSEKSRSDMEKANAKQLKEGVCVRSTSPYAAATFMIYRSTDGGEPKPRMVHDYRFMNMLLRVPAYPIPHIWTSLSTVQRSVYMTSVDIVSAFHCMWLTEESRQYTAYSTPFGLFEYITGCFGIASMPSEFQMRIEELFASPILQRWFLVYIDDGLIASETFEAHLWQLHVILSILSISGCRIALKKCHFAVPEVKYLGHKLTGLTLSLDDGRVLAIKAWARPENRKNIQELLGFLNYHRNFIRGFSSIVRPLQALVPISAPFVWGEEQEAAFEASKQAMVDAVTLFKPDFSEAARPFIVYTDASFTGLGAALYQTQQVDGTFREVPICFISRKLGDTEQRYAATQLECLCVVWMLEKLHFYLHGAKFTIVTDCDALKTLLTARWVNRHMIRWQVGIQDYHGQFEIVHRAGAEHANADGPSRNPLPNDESNPASDTRRVISVGGVTFDRVSQYEKQAWFPQPGTAASFVQGESAQPDASANSALEEHETDKHDSIGVQAGWAELDRRHLALPTGTLAVARIGLVRPPVQVGASITASIAEGTQEDVTQGYQRSPEAKSVLAALQQEDDSLLIPEAHSSLRTALKKRRLHLLGGIIYYSEFGPSGAAAYIADEKTQLKLLDACHDELMAGHFAADKTFERLRSFCWWPGMRETCAAYCDSCEPCAKAKAHTGRPFGLLQYIESPTEPWSVVNMDFVTALPPAGLLSYDAVLVVKCRLTRRTRLIPCWKTVDAAGVAALFAAHIVCQHGLPSTIISDRDPKFTSDFWKNLSAALGIKLAMTTAHNPQADGLAEREIKSLSEHLRVFVNFGTLQDGKNIKRDWVDALPYYEYAYNASRHASTNEIPFEADIGRVPRNSMDGLAELLKRAPSAASRGVRGYARLALALQKRAEAAVRLNHEAAKRRYDGKHQESPVRAGDFVLLSTKHFDFSDTYNKLKAAWMGPYEVIEMVGPNAARLHLPPPLDRRHPVFSVRYLKPAAKPQNVLRFQGRREYLSARPKVGLAGETYAGSEVAKVLDQRSIRNPEGEVVRQVLVRWKGYGLDSDVWVRTAQFNEKKDPAWVELMRDFRLARRTEGGALSELDPIPDLDSDLQGLPSVQDDQATTEDEEWEVEKIVKQRPVAGGKPGEMEYRVRWTGYGPRDDTWLKAHDLRAAPEALQTFRDSLVHHVLTTAKTPRRSRRTAQQGADPGRVRAKP